MYRHHGSLSIESFMFLQWPRMDRIKTSSRKAFCVFFMRFIATVVSTSHLEQKGEWSVLQSATTSLDVTKSFTNKL